MLRLLLKSLRGRPIRTTLAIAGIATCTLLVIVISSVLRGVSTSMAGYIGQEGFDVWVTPRGADNLIRGSFVSFIPLPYLDSLRAVPGVAVANPVLEAFLPVSFPRGNDPNLRLTLITIGYVLPHGLGGPPVYSEGRPPRRRDEVALDRAAASRFSARVGDTLDVSGYPEVITGITSGTNLLVTQFLFVGYEAMARGSNAQGLASFVILRVLPGAEGSRVAAAVEERFTLFHAYTRERFLATNEREVSSGYIPVLALIAVLGAGAAMLLVGLLILSVIDERRGDIAVLMALGAGTPSLSRGILVHTAALSAGGACIGIALAWALSRILDLALPTVPMVIAPWEVAGIAVLFTVTGMGAAIAPVLRLGTIDPLEAFRS